MYFNGGCSSGAIQQQSTAECLHKVVLQSPLAVLSISAANISAEVRTEIRAWSITHRHDLQIITGHGFGNRGLGSKRGGR